MSKPTRNQLYDATIRRMVVQALAKKEKDFAETHREDTDEMLLEYLIRSASELEHTPCPKEILGWEYLLQRFGTWKTAVEKAGLPAAQTSANSEKFPIYQAEVELQKKLYRVKRAEKKARAVRRRKERMVQRRDGAKKEEK